MPDPKLSLDERLYSVSRYVDDDAVLRLTVFNAASAVVVRLAGRRLNDQGRVVPFVDRLVPSTNRVASTLDKPLNEGMLIGVTASIASGAPLDGQCYAVLAIGRASGSQFEETDILAAGQLTAARRLSFPGSMIAGPLDSPGAMRAIPGTTPAAGAEISETVPAGARWDLLAFAALLTSSVTAANRIVQLLVDDGTTVYLRKSNQQNQAASLAWNYSWGAGEPLLNSGGLLVVHGSLPVGLSLAAGHRIRTSTTAIQVGDQFSAVEYLVRERIEGA